MAEDRDTDRGRGRVLAKRMLWLVYSIQGLLYKASYHTAPQGLQVPLEVPCIT